MPSFRTMCYLGHMIDSDRLHPFKEKTEAIEKALVLKNTTELRAFLPLLNYYGKFMPNLSSEIKPMMMLLQKDKEWVWTEECQIAFEHTKAQLSSTPVLAHYDRKLPAILGSDASPYRVGTVIAHQLQDGSEKPIPYASHTLSKTEVNYVQIEKKALSIIFGVTIQ